MTLHVVLMISALIAVFIVGRKSINKLVERIGNERNIPLLRVQYVNKVLMLAWSLLCLVGLGMVAGIGYEDFGLFFTSVFAVLGVALFAQWSILSNVTASIIVFFFFPYRIGDYVRIVDGDNTVQGTIQEITLFHVILQDGESIVTYPNALVFQKAVQITHPPEPEKISSGFEDDIQGM